MPFKKNTFGKESQERRDIDVRKKGYRCKKEGILLV
jgi:hypothetical protein